MTEFLHEHSSVKSIGHPAKDNSVFVLDVPSNLSFEETIKWMASELELEQVSSQTREIQLPETSSVVVANNQFRDSIILVINDVNQKPIDLLFIDEICKGFTEKGISIYSVGCPYIPCIRGSRDLRGLLSMVELVRILRECKAVITNDEEIRDLGEALSLNYFYLCEEDGVHYCNGNSIAVPGQVFNLISKSVQ